LMLRSGYSSDAVLRELATRHYGDAFDSGTATRLTKAGATPALLDALRNGSFQASAEEISAAEQKIAAQEEAVREAQERFSAPPGRREDTTGTAGPNERVATTTVNQVYQLLK